MSPGISQELVDALRTTLLQLEQTAGVPADDPAFVALKGILLRKIADIEMARAAETLSTSETVVLADDSAEVSSSAAAESSEAA